ncbi:MAG: carboxypeptidase regulatory-like domain-containing protein [Pirellulales bacterium]|nr:carboxypeptidase regulatory-like domain-containing protein [Pirellulales bacterium]
MKKMNTFTLMMVALATLGLCFPSVGLCSTTTAKPQVSDVALMNGNVLVGQVVNSSGAAVTEAPVLLQQENRTIATLKTNKDGFFAAKNVPAGIYDLSATDGKGVYRLWAPKTAPPTAQKGALLVTGKNVARGQYGSGLRNMLANPWIVGGIVAAAVAIPVAIHNADNDSPASP